MPWLRKKPPIPSRLNIAFVSQSSPSPLGQSTRRSQGAPSFLRLIARGLAFRGHAVTLIAGDIQPIGSMSTDSDGVRLVSAFPERASRYQLQTGVQSSHPRFQEQIKSRFLEIHKKEPFHIVHALDHSALQIGLLKKRLPRELRFNLAFDVQATQLIDLFGLIGRGEDSFTGLLQTGLRVASRFLKSYFAQDRALLSTADGVFVASPRERIALERYYLYPDDRIHTVPYGIDISANESQLFEQGDRSAQVLPSWLPASDSTPIAVTVTDMTEVGEMRSLLRAFERVAVRLPTARLIVIGNGPRFKEIEFECLMLALGNRVTFTGALSAQEERRAIGRANVFINLSARSSGFEPSLLEAMMLKKVVIGSEVSPIASLLEHNRDGFLVRPADINEIAELLLAVFESRIDAAGIGDSARNRVSSLFEPEKMVIETLKAYRKILQQSGHYSPIQGQSHAVIASQV